MRFFAALLVGTLLLGSWVTATSAQPVAAPTPAPSPVLRVIPLGPNGAPASTPTPAGALVRYSGQLLDVERGFAFFTTGDGFRLAPDAKIVDAKTGAAVTAQPSVRMYATATFDKSSGKIVQLAVSKAPIAGGAEYGSAGAYAAVQNFAVSQSAVSPSTDERPNAYHGPAMTGKGVAVTFVVQIPPLTPLTDQVYITTDVSNWDPKAILMVRIDAMHYRATTQFASGTIFHYKYDRGSFRTIEIGQNGLDDPPHTFTVRESDALRRDDIVYHWKDETVGTGTTNIGPGSIPTPFNPSGILNLPTPPAPFGPTPVKTFPPGVAAPPNTGPGGTRGPAKH
jgi:hypothetical protein